MKKTVIKPLKGNILMEKEMGKEKNMTQEGKYSKEIIQTEKKYGKGKEFGFSGEVIFEGEYSNGKRKGKGKEFINGKIIYDGEYLNGLKWNGKGYDQNCNKIYELKDGEGLVKEYDIDGFLSFEGEYKNGKRNERVKNIMKMIM